MRKLFLTALLLSATLGSEAQVKLTVSEPVDVDGDWVVEIGLENPNEKINTFQFDLSVPSDFSYTMGNYVFSSRATEKRFGKDMDTHSMVSNSVTNGGTIRCIVYSNENKALKGTEGTVVSLLLTGKSTAAVTPLNLTNIVVGKLDEEDKPSETGFYPQAQVGDSTLKCSDYMDNDAFVIGTMGGMMLEEMNINLKTNPHLRIVDLSRCTNESLGTLDIVTPQTIVLCAHEAQVENEDNVLYKDENGKYVCQSLKLYDNAEALELPVPAEAKKVTYSRNFTNTKWQALYLPLEIPAESLLEDYDLAEVRKFTEDEESYRLTVGLINGGTLTANKPYFIRAHETGQRDIVWENLKVKPAVETEETHSTETADFTLKGNYSICSDMYVRGSYAMGGGALVQAASETTTLGAYRWLMDVNTAAGVGKQMRFEVYDEEVTTGIEQMSGKPASVKLFDLLGRQMSAPQRGIYIENGKVKVMGH